MYINKFIKVIILSAGILLASCNPVYADTLCSGQAELAEAVMKARQNGMSIVKSMKFADSVEDTGLRNAIKAIIEMAYSEQRYNSDEYKQKVITEFQNKIYLLCLKATARSM